MATGKRHALEHLEERTLMAGDFGVVEEIAWGQFSPAPLIDLGSLADRPIQGPAGVAIPRPWIRSDDTAAPYITYTDHGDFYWADNKQIPLLRADNAVLLQVAPGVDVSNWLASVQAPGGPLAGFEVQVVEDRGIVELIAPAGISNQLALDVLSDDANVLWISPKFTSQSTTGSWVTNELIVALDIGVDPATFFGGQYDYRQLAGTPDTWILTIDGGFADVLAAAQKFYFQDGVQYAEPDFMSRLSFGPIGPDSVQVWPSPITPDELGLRPLPNLDTPWVQINPAQPFPFEPVGARPFKPQVASELNAQADATAAEFETIGWVIDPLPSQTVRYGTDTPKMSEEELFPRGPNLETPWVQVNPARPIPTGALRLGGIVIGVDGEQLPPQLYIPRPFKRPPSFDQNPDASTIRPLALDDASAANGVANSVEVPLGVILHYAHTFNSADTLKGANPFDWQDDEDA